MSEYEYENWLEKAAKLAGVSVPEIADACGVSVQAVYKWYKTGGFARKHLPTLAKLLDENESYLLEGTNSKRSSFSIGEQKAHYSNVQDGPQPRPYSFAPITGRVRGGDNGYIFEEGYPVGDSDEFIQYHGKDKSAFGLRVIGDSMSPRYNHGEYIIACPNLVYSVGKYVYVAYKDGRKMLKRLAAEQEDAFRLESINPNHPIITVLRADIDCMYVVQGPFDSDAIIHR